MRTHTHTHTSRLDISIATYVTHCGFVERKLVRAHAAINLSTAALIFPRDLQRRARSGGKRDPLPRDVRVCGGLITPSPKRRKYTGASSPSSERMFLLIDRETSSFFLTRYAAPLFLIRPLERYHARLLGFAITTRVIEIGRDQSIPLIR